MPKRERGNDVQHKKRKEKLIRIQITTIRHGGLGHWVHKSWTYLSNVAPSPYGLSNVKNEFSLVVFTACQCENGPSGRESFQKQWWVNV